MKTQAAFASWCLRGGIVFATALAVLGGCSPPAPKAQQRAFVEKPAVAPADVHSASDVFGAYARRSDDPKWGEWISQAPEPWRGLLAEDHPLPASPCYEFLRCRQDYTGLVDSILAGEYQRSRKEADVQDAQAALRRLLAGSAAMELGLHREAQTHFRKAAFWMEDATDKDLELLAVLGRSDAKLYAGDAVERSMVHFYLGVIAYQLADFEEARREFFRAIKADQTKPAESVRGKFAMLHYWLAKACHQLGDTDNRDVELRAAKNSGDAPQAAPLFDPQAVASARLTVLVQIGSGPTVVVKGADWQTREHQKTETPEKACEVYVDGRHVGSALPLADLWHQISTQGISKERRIQQAKGGVKALAQNLPYVNLLAVGWDVRGDVRSWAMLPQQFLIWSGEVPPGDHSVVVKFYDGQDYELVRYRQTWHFVPVAKDRDSLVLLRSCKDKCNINRKENP